jgi:hypothetical protein
LGFATVRTPAAFDAMTVANDLGTRGGDAAADVRMLMASCYAALVPTSGP